MMRDASQHLQRDASIGRCLNIEYANDRGEHVACWCRLRRIFDGDGQVIARVKHHPWLDVVHCYIENLSWLGPLIEPKHYFGRGLHTSMITCAVATVPQRSAVSGHGAPTTMRPAQPIQHEPPWRLRS